MMIAPVRFGLMLVPPPERQRDPIEFFDIPKPLERQLQELAGIHGRRQVIAERAYFRSPDRRAELADSELKELRGLNKRFEHILLQLRGHLGTMANVVFAPVALPNLSRCWPITDSAANPCKAIGRRNY